MHRPCHAAHFAPVRWLLHCLTRDAGCRCKSRLLLQLAYRIAADAAHPTSNGAAGDALTSLTAAPSAGVRGDPFQPVLLLLPRRRNLETMQSAGASNQAQQKSALIGLFGPAMQADVLNNIKIKSVHAAAHSIALAGHQSDQLEPVDLLRPLIAPSVAHTLNHPFASCSGGTRTAPISSSSSVICTCSHPRHRPTFQACRRASWACSTTTRCRARPARWPSSWRDCARPLSPLTESNSNSSHPARSEGGDRDRQTDKEGVVVDFRV